MNFKKELSFEQNKNLFINAVSRICDIQGNPNYNVLDISNCIGLQYLLSQHRVLIFNEPDFDFLRDIIPPSEVTKIGNLTQMLHIDNFDIRSPDPRTWNVFSYQGQNRGSGTVFIDSKALNPHLEELFDITFSHYCNIPQEPTALQTAIPFDKEIYQKVRKFTSSQDLAQFCREEDTKNVYEALNIVTKMLKENIEFGEEIRPQLNELYMTICKKNGDLTHFEPWDSSKLIIAKNRPDEKGYCVHGRVTLDDTITSLESIKPLGRVWAGNTNFR